MNLRRPPTAAQVHLFQEVGRRLDAKGMVAANDGNLSLRDPDGTVLVTATGARKGYLKADEVVRVDAEGALLWGARSPSSEVAMHLLLLGARPDRRAVVHAHPATATGFAVAGQPMDACVLPEIILSLGSVPIAPYATPGTAELPAAALTVARSHDVFLLANHGAVAMGEDLEDAYFRMERLEHTARILLVARLLGRTQVLSEGAVSRLLATGAAPHCGEIPCRTEPGAAELAAIIQQVLEERGL